MKILVTGGEGVLAQYIKKSLQNSSLLSPGHVELDVTDENAVNKYFKKNSPDAIIHLAAKTDVDWCEKNPEKAFLVNSEGTKNIAKACKDIGSLLVYISTAAVFSGEKNIFYEDDSVSPVNIYGKSKLQGEEYIKEALNKYLILRAAWLIGGGRKEKKFISYILDQLTSGAKEIKAVEDKYGTITYAKELSDLIRTFLISKETGVFHFGSKGACSRFDIAKKIVLITKKNVKLLPVSSSYFLNKFSAPRPNREVIGSKKMDFPNTWEESLENYLRSEIIPEYAL